jgi:hypothetical protein
VKARIGIADAGREIEVEVAGRDEVVEYLESAYREDVAILWFKNAKGRDIGVPLGRIAFVELVDDRDQAVGFGR